MYRITRFLFSSGTIGDATHRVLGSGKNSIYAAQTGTLRTWPELDGAKSVPENIFTHLKLDSKPSYKMTHFKGHVVSTKMMKTIAVRVDHIWTHPKVGKRVTRSKKFLAHDEGEVARVGDFVEVKLSRKLSRHKAWTLNKILKRENYLTDEPNATIPEVVPYPKLPARKPRTKKVAREQKLVLKRQRKADAIQSQAAKEEYTMKALRVESHKLAGDAEE